MNRWTRTIILLAFLVLANSPAFPQNSRDGKLVELVALLYRNPWNGPELVGESPTQWEFNLTEPMKLILEIGNPAQETLLEKVNDPEIMDQVMFLLGGVGDESAIEPILENMVRKESLGNTRAKRINRAANLALTNITVAEVIWHHGGGVVVERCPVEARECWLGWWKRNRSTFSISAIKQSRRYSNYPNYGIYRNRQ